MSMNRNLKNLVSRLDEANSARGANHDRGDFENGEFQRANFKGADFYLAKFQDATLAYVDFDGANFAGSDLSGAKNLDKAKLPKGYSLVKD
jgi:uncharacterized protein YjbI with pentapeptide repeats